jgi:hypothetical protein
VSNTPLSDAALAKWDDFEKFMAEALGPGSEEFMAAVRKRVDAGRREYGDSSFTIPTERVYEEIRQECLDIVGWMIPLWWRPDTCATRREELREHAVSAHETWRALRA